MIAEKYYNDFIIAYGKKEVGVIKTIIEVEKENNKSLVDWNEEDLKKFLLKKNSTSEKSLHKHLSVLRQYANYIADKEGIARRQYVLTNRSLTNYVNRDKLLSVTINYNEYKHIISQIENVRDRLIVELAWYSLTNKQIKMLKEKEIVFEQSEYGWDIAFLEIGRAVSVRIDDPKVVEDIKQCMNESGHIIETSQSIEKDMQYKFSEYLIKPMNVGKGKELDYFCNPSLILTNIFLTQKIKCEGVPIEGLSINDIRRSGLIYLFAPENEKNFSLESIVVLYGLKNDTSLFWIRKFAKEKYK
jgi:TusA-related sulfurtransferase